MLAIIKEKPGHGAALKEVDIPKLQAGEAIIRVRRASICGSDMSIYQWNSWASRMVKLPHVFGHEVCGEIVEIQGALSKGTGPLFAKGLSLLSKGDFVAVESH